MMICWGIHHKNYFEAPHDRNKQYVFIFNHISYMDVPMIVKVIRQPARALGKAELSKVPVFGFLYRYGTIMVDRSDPEKRKKSVLQLKSVLRKGISVFIFPLPPNTAVLARERKIIIIFFIK